MWDSRSTEPELLDLGPTQYSEEEYEKCLIQLDRIGRWLGGDRATLAALRQLKQNPKSILDVGCGGGLFTARLALLYPEAQVTGIDMNPQAIAFAQKRASLMPNQPKNLFFKCQKEEELEANEKYDLVMTTLVCHHMSDRELVDFIVKAKKTAKKIIINDLHRHPLPFYLFKILSPLLFNNRLIQHDGALSIRRGFKYRDWIHYLQQAQLKPNQYKIQRKFAFRWLVEIDGNNPNDP